MNKKGFTLSELLAVIVIISILSLIAVPNIINIVDKIKKGNMLNDAKRLISLAKAEVNANYSIRQEAEHYFAISTLDKNNDITNDPDGGVYVTGGENEVGPSYGNNSYVKYTKSTNTYCIYLNGSRRRIGTNNSCVSEKSLHSENIVITKESVN